MAKKKETVDIAIRPTHVRVFDFIDKFMKENAYSPTLQEISEGVDPKISYRYVYILVAELVKSNYLSKKPNQDRGLSVIRDIRSNN